MRVSGRERIRIVRRRLARARLFSLCVVLAVFSVTSRIAFDADAIDLAARFFVFIGFGALRATVDHAVGLRCVSCCRGARALVRASPLVAKKNVACFSGETGHAGEYFAAWRYRRCNSLSLKRAAVGALGVPLKISAPSLKVSSEWNLWGTPT